MRTDTEQIRRLDSFWNDSLDDVLSAVGAMPEGLTSTEAERRRRVFGPNALEKESPFASLLDLLHNFANPLVILLLIASVISFLIGQHANAVIIITMVLLSVTINYYQEYQARHAVAALRKQVATTARVMRDDHETNIPLADLVPGDLVRLTAGDLIPADMRLLYAKDLYVRESALTGESLPVEKNACELPEPAKALGDVSNSLFFGTSVQSGLARGIVVRTGSSTAFGGIAARLAEHPPESEFERGTREFGLLITRVILLLVVIVFLLNFFLQRPVFTSLLFALALAVGLTPELLPMITVVTLSQGAKRMARKKVIVKQLSSIEHFGSMEILCCDKTGTLTEGEIVLDRHINLQGEEDERVLFLFYLNSVFQAGINSPMDEAILRHEELRVDDFRKIDEMPFDFTRKRLSVVVRRGEESVLITKGAVEAVLDVCHRVEWEGRIAPLTEERRRKALQLFRLLSGEGYRVLAVAVKIAPEKECYTVDDENNLTLFGLAAFLDPLRPDVGEALETLRADGINPVIMTGDNEFITRKIVEDVGLSTEHFIVGDQMDELDDDALAYLAEHGAVFARVSPEQKNRVIVALKSRGRVVGFLGDGINDAPSMHTADIGISVMNGVDVAKQAANIILLEKDLHVMHEGVIEGRKSFANIMKFITMGVSSNFGHMLSMAISPLLLPFLPMLPTQILLSNLLFDFSQVSIPSDNVDEEALRAPRRWRIDQIRRFMLTIGPIATAYDLATFALFILVFHIVPPMFHTAWFLASISTTILVVFVIRTRANPLRSRPSAPLTFTMLATLAIAVMLPYSAIGNVLGFVPLPASLLISISALTILYLVLTQWVKSRLYRSGALT